MVTQPDLPMVHVATGNDPLAAMRRGISIAGWDAYVVLIGHDEGCPVSRESEMPLCTCEILWLTNTGRRRQ